MQWPKTASGQEIWTELYEYTRLQNTSRSRNSRKTFKIRLCCKLFTSFST